MAFKDWKKSSGDYWYKGTDDNKNGQSISINRTSGLWEDVVMVQVTNREKKITVKRFKQRKDALQFVKSYMKSH